MGNNAAYTVFEESVIKSYDSGQLSKSLLSTLMESYRDTDIDFGGSRDLLTKDGKDVEIVVIETMGLIPPEEPLDDGEEKSEAYYESKYSLFRSITNLFNWR